MSNEMYNTVARVTDGLYEGSHILAALFNLIFLAAVMCGLKYCSEIVIQFGYGIGTLQVLLLEVMCSQVLLSRTMFCDLTISLR